MTYTIVPIATARSPYKQKFGVARQPGLVPAAEVCIELNPKFTADSVRGLEHFDYVWVSFIFHGVLDEGWAQMVRPPRLGGKQKMGVFATRSPPPSQSPRTVALKTRTHRNRQTRPPLLQRRRPAGRHTDCRHQALHPLVESKPDASSGFVSGKPEELEVVWLENIGAEKLSEGTQNLISQA